MADRRKDVELVIRARQEASKAVDAVTGALETLLGIQNDLTKGAQKTGSVLDRLGEEFRQLNAEVAGLGALSKVSSQLDRATAAVGRLETEVASTTAELSRLSEGAARAANTTNALKAAAGATQHALRNQREATAAARVEQTAANRAVEDAQRALTKYKTQLDKTLYPGSAQRSASAFLEADLEAARVAQEAAIRGYQKQSTALQKTKDDLRDLGAQVRVSSQHQRALADEADKASFALDGQRNALDKSRAELGQIQGSAAAASKALGGVAVNSKDLAAESQRAAKDLQRVTEALKNQKAAASTTTQGPAATAVAAYRKQAQAIKDAEKAWRDAQAEASKLGAAMSRAAEPTREIQTAFLLARNASREARAEYINQIATLNQLKGVTQGSFAAFEQNVARLRIAADAQSAFAAATGQAQGATNSAGAGLRGLGSTAQGTAGALGTASSAANALRSALTGIYGESRQSLSLLQRLRGEVLSLTAGYLGLQAAISRIGGVITAFQTLEAAQNRLGGVFNQDTSRVASELDFLERQAQRLGIQFGVLSDEYSKFAVAANGANFSAETTRRIFLAVAEAGRVNKLTTDQMQGSYLALTQMISKGKIQSEELRRQLGDRLPGAFNIMAKALGMTTAELDKAMQQGEVFATQSNLLRFADELDRRFGGQLPTSLQSLTTEIGEFGNEMYQAQLRVAQGGFADALRDLLSELNGFFQSREGRDFFLGLGSALGTFTRALAVVPRYFDQITSVLSVLAAFKIGSFFVTLSKTLFETRAAAGAASAGLFTYAGTIAAVQARLAQFSATAVAFGTTLAGMRAQVLSTTGTISALGASTVALNGMLAATRASIGLLAGSFRVLWAAVGGWVGIAATAITFIAGDLLGEWLTNVDDATEAIDEHRRVVGQVGQAYEAAKGKVDNWANGVKDVTLSQAAGNLDKMRDSYNKLTADLSKDVFTKTTGIGSVLRGQASLFSKEITKIQDLSQRLRDGKLTVTEYSAELEKLYAGTTDKNLKDFIEGLQDQVVELRAASDRMRDAATAARALGDRSASTADIIQRLNGSMPALTGNVEDLNNALADEETKKFEAGLAAIKDLIPELANEIDRTKNLAELDNILSGMGLAKTKEQLEDLLILSGQARRAINDTANEKIIDDDYFDRVMNAESGGVKGQKSTTSTAAGLAGFTEQTWIEFFDRVFEGLANKDRTYKLSKRDDENFVRPILDAFTKQNANALVAANQPVTPRNLYLSHFLGSGDAIKVLIANPAELAANIVRKESVKANPKQLGGGATVGDVLDFAEKKVSVSDAEIEAHQALADIQNEQNEKVAEYNKLYAQRISDAQFETEILKLSKREQEIQRQLREAANEATKAGTALTREQEEAIRKTTGALYDQQNVGKELEEQKKKANEQEQIANDLYTQRTTLIEQLQYYQANGDQTQVTALEEALTSVNTQLADAITKAIAMWEAVGGPAADAAIAKLKNVEIAIANSGNKSLVTGKQINNMLADGIVDGFERAGDAIAKGENALTALRDAFLQFASDFLREIAKMILKQAILNALQNGGGEGGGAGGFIANAINSIFRHGGGLASGGVGRRAVPAAWFANAQRFHGGGIPGLKPNEVPTILERNEEVLRQDDPRHIFNGGGATPQQTAVKILNLIDSGSFISAGLSTAEGEAAIMNFVKANKTSFQAALR